MYVLKAVPEICAPYSFQTDEPRTTKLDMGHLGSNLTPFEEIWSSRRSGGGATEYPFHEDFGFLLLSLTGLQTEALDRF